MIMIKLIMIIIMTIMMQIIKIRGDSNNWNDDHCNNCYNNGID